MRAVTAGDLRELPATVSLMTAARILGIGRTKAYHLARHDAFPCRVLRVGGSYLVPTADLLRLLGIEPGAAMSPGATVRAPRPRPSMEEPPARKDAEQ